MEGRAIGNPGQHEMRLSTDQKATGQLRTAPPQAFNPSLRLEIKCVRPQNRRLPLWRNPLRDRRPGLARKPSFLLQPLS